MPPSTLPSREPAPAAGSNSRVIRVFLSSTFRDFMEERDLLVKQVFPELRRKARERGVEVVDVDLRWGITEKESRQGKVIPICLGEIDRCRPYFVGMLGERYGWIPPADQYSPEVIERQPWLKEHMGGVSVTELEILHGVLREPKMAGRAFFYFRDSAWSTSQSKPGFVCETAKEKARLADLKKRISNSGFPVAENLPDPKVLADRIGQDLWELIEQQYPDLDEADALAREERQHASYRRSRLGVYLGGKRSINQLERWIDAGQQKILITGESGAGKSALITNWIEVHRQKHPEDVVFAHHLGCSNDASAIRPLLARLIDTAKQQLPEVYGYSLSVPQDWWELVAKAVEALQSLGRWAQQNNHRWIWVLDGLDRLAPDDQKALPWLPLTIPEGVVVLASALECPAREILLERKFKARTIAPLKAKEQDALIKQYLGRYTKQLIAELRQTILSHPLAGSPLFLRVLLEELRQCGRYETLAEQLTGYLSAETIDDLYERVLERLEADGNGENVRRVLTALWASRAGLSEEELLSITELAPLQWAPIDLALEEALGRNGNRLVFDHDFLRKAVEDRFLPTEKERRQAHSDLADWIMVDKCRKKQLVQEYLHQLVLSERLDTARSVFADLRLTTALHEEVSGRDLCTIWQEICPHGEDRLDRVLRSKLARLIRTSSLANARTIEAVEATEDLLSALCLEGETRIWTARLVNITKNRRPGADVHQRVDCMKAIATAYGNNEQWHKAENWMRKALDLARNSPHREMQRIWRLANELSVIMVQTDREENAISLLTSTLQELDQPGCSKLVDIEITALAILAHATSLAKGPEEAEPVFRLALKRSEECYGKYSPKYANILGNYGNAWSEKNELLAKEILEGALKLKESIYGPAHPSTTSSRDILVKVLNRMGLHKDCLSLAKQNLCYSERYLGKNAIESLEIRSHLALTCGNLYHLSGRESLRRIAEYLYSECLVSMEFINGPEHPTTNQTRLWLASFLSNQQRYDESIPLRRMELEVAVKQDGREAVRTLASIYNLAEDLYFNDEFQESEQHYREALAGRITAFGDDAGDTMASRYGLARCLSKQERYDEAIELRRIELAWCQANDDVEPADMLMSMHGLGSDLLAADQQEEALDLLQECLKQRQSLLGQTHDDTLTTLARVLDALSAQGQQRDAIALSQQAYQATVEAHGEAKLEALIQLSNQAYFHEELGEPEQAETLYRRCLEGREQALGAEHAETLSTVYNLADVLSQQERHAEAIPLRRRELAWCREQNGDTDPGTLTSINGLAIDLRETGALEEAEALFCELVKTCQQVLEPEDFQIGRALGGLAKTLEEAGKLEEALTYRRQALEHRLTHESSDAWWANRERLDLARVLHKLERNAEATALLQELMANIGRNIDPDDDDRQLQRDAEELILAIEES
jgi:nephrocystin-3